MILYRFSYMSYSFREVLRLERFRRAELTLCVCLCLCVCVGGKEGMLTCLRRCRGWWWDSRVPEWWPTVWIGYCPWSCLGEGHPQGLITAYRNIHKHGQTRFKLPWAKESNKATHKQVLPHCQWTWLLQLGISAPPPLWLLQWPGGQSQMDPCECP